MEDITIQIIAQCSKIINLINNKKIKQDDLKQLLKQNLRVLNFIEKSECADSLSLTYIKKYKDKFEEILK